MRISIGILAYNESSCIATTIRSVLAQSLLREPAAEIERVEVVCVPNGCTDDTAAIAAEALGALQPELSVRIETSVHVLDRGSKVNAWTQFVHSVADPQAKYLFLLDGDIRVDHPDTFRNLVAALEADPAALVAAPKAVKQIELRGCRSPVEWLSVRLGELNRARPYGFAGCCYCVRGDVARRIWFPAGMVGEDAFLNGLIVTDLCRSKGRYERVVRPADARVVFEAYTRIGKIYRVLRRQAVTRGTNAILWTYLWANVGESDAGEIIRRRNEENPGWYMELIRDHVNRSGWWIMPKGAVTRRLKYLRFLPRWKALLVAPVACVGSVVDLVVHIDANRMIRRGKISGLWEATRTTQI